MGTHMNCSKMLGALAMLATAIPASATSSDPVLASFERMLEHRPAVVVKPAPAGFPADPLVAAVRAPLWRGTSARPAAVAADDVPLARLGCASQAR